MLKKQKDSTRYGLNMIGQRQMLKHQIIQKSMRQKNIKK